MKNKLLKALAWLVLLSVAVVVCFLLFAMTLAFCDMKTLNEVLSKLFLLFLPLVLFLSGLWAVKKISE